MTATPLGNAHTDCDMQANAETQERVINYYCGPVAWEAHKSRAQVKLVWGALGTAKTSWLCWRVFYLARRAAKHGLSLRALLVRDTYRNLADSTLKTFLDWFPEGSVGYKARSEPADYKLYVEGIYHDVAFRHGQTEQDASMFLSTEYDFIGLEEIAPAFLPGAQRISPGIAEGVFDMALPRLTREAKRAEAIRPELAMTCNSPPLAHWSSKRIIDKPADYLHSLNWSHWNFPVSDNLKNLRPDYYEKLERAWEGKRALIQRFVRGERIAVFVGIPRFNLDQLDRMRGHCQEPSFRGFLRPTKDNLLHVKLEANSQGFVRIWQPPKLDRRYVIGGDSAEGVEGGDWLSGHVLDTETLDVVAAWHGHVEPETFAAELGMLGYLYNCAKIGVESYPSAHGLTTLTKLKALGYPHIFYSRNLESRGHSQERIGWRSTTRTKAVLIDGIGEHLQLQREPGEPDPVIVDADLIGELQTYGVMENGSTGAQEGCHDDRVISYGVALLMARTMGLESIYPGLRRQ